MHKVNIIRSMYQIGSPYNFPLPAPAYTMEAFVAPADFNPDAQDLNIVQAFAAYPDANKKYIYSVSPSVASTTLDSVSGRSYAYSQNGGSYTVIASGTVTWIGGSTKRNIVVIDSASTITATVAIGGVWAYLTDKCYSVNSYNNQYLKYIHCQKLSSLTDFVDASFRYCSSLTGCLNIPPYLTSIRTFTFSGCSALTSICFSNSLITIARDAFGSCIGLSEITLPDSLVTLQYNAFSNCTGLVSIHIPNTVLELGNGVFSYCNHLLSINLPTQLQNISIGLFLACTNITEIVIPTSVTSISDYAMQDCSHLSNITIPASISTIADATFYQCSNLSIINCYRQNPPTLGTSYGSVVFFGVNKNNCVLHVPVGSKAAYQAAAQWSAFTNIIEDL